LRTAPLLDRRCGIALASAEIEISKELRYKLNKK
jgi:hypothetical protein